MAAPKDSAIVTRRGNIESFRFSAKQLGPEGFRRAFGQMMGGPR